MQIQPEELRESWFAREPEIPRPSTSSEPPPQAASSPSWSMTLVGAATGAIAGAFALLVAGFIARAQDAPALSTIEGFVVGAVSGALMGSGLRLVVKASTRWIARVLFAVAIAAAVWFCIHVALVFRQNEALPLLP